MEFFIPRDLMPQIDQADYPALIRFCREREVGVIETEFEPKTLKFHQRVDTKKAVTMPVAVARKPVLVSSDHFILDGNHRDFWHLEHHEKVKAIQIGLPFPAAIGFLRAFPKTYSYGDGNFHPVRN